MKFSELNRNEQRKTQIIHNIPKHFSKIDDNNSSSSHGERDSLISKERSSTGMKEGERVCVCLFVCVCVCVNFKFQKKKK